MEATWCLQTRHSHRSLLRESVAVNTGGCQLTAVGNVVTANVDGKQVASVEDGDHSHGFAALASGVPGIGERCAFTVNECGVSSSAMQRTSTHYLEGLVSPQRCNCTCLIPDTLLFHLVAWVVALRPG